MGYGGISGGFHSHQGLNLFQRTALMGGGIRGNNGVIAHGGRLAHSMVHVDGDAIISSEGCI